MGVLSVRVLMMVFMAVSLTSMAYADEGTATFYTPPYVPSSCNGFQNDGVMIAAASDDIWNNGAACGRSYRVTCTGATNQGVPHPCNGGSVVVKIVDYCPPPGCQGTIDLSQEAFANIANTDAAKITILYNQV
ncbi:EG45-like domain containing protein [Quillaja saponaria]|uniref:EG45-like domain containing protein n=1 Tax=Quillaja saponaria TaxID=32244 RepID=A0AAD7QDJ0_QUISA|nr:EG45-like domain containing protein [Quillaja saponaria]